MLCWAAPAQHVPGRVRPPPLRQACAQQLHQQPAVLALGEGLLRKQTARRACAALCPALASSRLIVCNRLHTKDAPVGGLVTGPCSDVRPGLGGSRPQPAFTSRTPARNHCPRSPLKRDLMYLHGLQLVGTARSWAPTWHKSTCPGVQQLPLASRGPPQEPGITAHSHLLVSGPCIASG